MFVEVVGYCSLFRGRGEDAPHLKVACSKDSNLDIIMVRVFFFSFSGSSLHVLHLRAVAATTIVVVVVFFFFFLSGKKRLPLYKMFGYTSEGFIVASHARGTGDDDRGFHHCSRKVAPCTSICPRTAPFSTGVRLNQRCPQLRTHRPSCLRHTEGACRLRCGFLCYFFPAFR